MLVELVGNNLGGPLPPSLAEATGLPLLLLQDNLLSGTIPASLFAGLKQLTTFGPGEQPNSRMMWICKAVRSSTLVRIAAAPDGLRLAPA